MPSNNSPPAGFSDHTKRDKNKKNGVNQPTASKQAPNRSKCNLWFIFWKY